ncbi:MAG: hypothetical protein HQL52_14320 [Magnetococcales bacterium]|nr:hypothetical protein [Magnetococcales bacterium]
MAEAFSLGYLKVLNADKAPFSAEIPYWLSPGERLDRVWVTLGRATDYISDQEQNREWAGSIKVLAPDRKGQPGRLLLRGREAAPNHFDTLLVRVRIGEVHYFRNYAFAPELQPILTYSPTAKSKSSNSSSSSKTQRQRIKSTQHTQSTQPAKSAHTSQTKPIRHKQPSSASRSSSHSGQVTSVPQWVVWFRAIQKMDPWRLAAGAGGGLLVVGGVVALALRIKPRVKPKRKKKSKTKRRKEPQIQAVTEKVPSPTPPKQENSQAAPEGGKGAAKPARPDAGEEKKSEIPPLIPLLSPTPAQGAEKGAGEEAGEPIQSSGLTEEKPESAASTAPDPAIDSEPLSESASADTPPEPDDSDENPPATGREVPSKFAFVKPDMALSTAPFPIEAVDGSDAEEAKNGDIPPVWSPGKEEEELQWQDARAETEEEIGAETEEETEEKAGVEAVGGEAPAESDGPDWGLSTEGSQAEEESDLDLPPGTSGEEEDAFASLSPGSAEEESDGLLSLPEASSEEESDEFLSLPETPSEEEPDGFLSLPDVASEDGGEESSLELPGGVSENHSETEIAALSLPETAAAKLGDADKDPSPISKPTPPAGGSPSVNSREEGEDIEVLAFDPSMFDTPSQGNGSGGSSIPTRDAKSSSSQPADVESIPFSLEALGSPDGGEGFGTDGRGDKGSQDNGTPPAHSLEMVSMGAAENLNSSTLVAKKPEVSQQPPDIEKWKAPSLDLPEIESPEAASPGGDIGAKSQGLEVPSAAPPPKKATEEIDGDGWEGSGSMGGWDPLEDDYAIGETPDTASTTPERSKSNGSSAKKDLDWGSEGMADIDDLLNAAAPSLEPVVATAKEEPNRQSRAKPKGDKDGLASPSLEEMLQSVDMVLQEDVGESDAGPGPQPGSPKTASKENDWEGGEADWGGAELDGGADGDAS